MKHNTAWLILLGLALAGCHRAARSSADDDFAVEWFKMPPVPRITQQETLIPLLKIGGTYYTTTRGMEIPLVKTAEGLTWGLLPSPLADTTIGYFGPSYPCSIRIVDRTRAAFDESYVPEKSPPVLMTKVDEPEGLPKATARPPRKLDDFVGVYYPLWFPWVRMEIRKKDGQYWSAEQAVESPKPPLKWTPQGRQQILTPVTDKLGFIGFPGGPHSLTYNEALKRFEFVRLDNGVKMPLARVSSGKDIRLPPLPIGIPTWR